MSFLSRLASSTEAEAPGSWHTAREIAQQPEVWPRVLDMLEARAAAVRDFLDRSGASGSAGSEASVVLTGAGSSDFVGRAAAASLGARLGRCVSAVPTTHLVTHPVSRLDPHRRLVVVHCARSGDSPESVAAWRILHKARPDASHVVITCNPSGALAGASAADTGSLLLTLPPETNDRSLAMTSSFTSMTLCVIALGWMEELAMLRRRVAPVCAAARRIILEEADTLAEMAARPFDRACYLGSDVLEGVMNEGALKMLEMTAGKVITVSNSFLGLRHGPQVFVNHRCLVVAGLSADAAVRRYERDLLGSLKEKGQGAGMVAICSEPDAAPAGVDALVSLAGAGSQPVIADDLRVLTDVVVCQVLAFAASRARGLAPDNPSPDGVISRVVQGVTLYDT